MNFDRHRRLRRSGFMRDMVRETTLSVNDLIYPIFVVEKPGLDSAFLTGTFEVITDE